MVMETKKKQTLPVIDILKGDERNAPPPIACIWAELALQNDSCGLRPTPRKKECHGVQQ